MIKKLIEIQKELKVPKNLYNKFGEYYYRSAEGILEAVKPLLAKHGLMLTLTDEVVNVGSSNYIIATATITDGEKTLSAQAYAREDEQRPKMTSGQLTGAASSYARKYALNGLFLLDDTKDADTDEFTKTQRLKPELVKEAEQVGVDLARLAAYLKKDQAELTESDVEKAIETKRKAKEQKEGVEQ